MPNPNFTEKELNIINRFLYGGESIRSITENGWGRTRIKNLLTRYGKENSDVKEEIENRLFKNKTHKPDDAENTLPEISDKQILDAYEQIKSGKSLRSVSEELGRSKDYIKSRIIDQIGEPDEINEFFRILKENQNPSPKNDFNFIVLPDEEKCQIIFNKLNERRANLKKNGYSEDLLKRKLDRLKKYLLTTRNNKISDDNNKISEDDFWKMLYDMPDLLAYSFSNKIKPAIQNLDSNPNLGYGKTSRIIKEDPSIIGSAIDRTNLQIKILKDNGLLRLFLAKPRYFRTSPELIYALIKLNDGKLTDDVFITKARLEDRYGINSTELIKKYDVKTEYGDDEYFDK